MIIRYLLVQKIKKATVSCSFLWGWGCLLWTWI